MSEGIQNITDILKLCWAPTNNSQYNYENDSEESATSNTLVKTLNNPDIENKIIRDDKNDKENSLNSEEYNFNQDLTLNDLEGISALDKFDIDGVSDELLSRRNGSMPEPMTEYTYKENIVKPHKVIDADRIREPLTGQAESEQYVRDKEQPSENNSSKDPGRSHHYQLRDKSCATYNHSLKTYQRRKEGDLGEDLVYSSTTPDYHDPDWRYANAKNFKIKKKLRRKKKKISRKKYFSEPINISYNLRSRELDENSSCLENNQLSLYYTDCQPLNRIEGRNINHVSNSFKPSEKYANCKAATSHSEGKKRNSYTLRQDTKTKRICLKAIQDPINVQPIPIITLKTSQSQKERKCSERTLKVKKMLLDVGSTLNQIEAALTDWNFGSRIPSTNEASYLLQQIQEINRSLKEEYDIICNTAIQTSIMENFLDYLKKSEDLNFSIQRRIKMLNKRYSTNSVYTEALLPLLKKLNIEKEEEIHRGSKYNFIIRKPSLLVNDLALKTSSSKFSEKTSEDKLSKAPLCNNSTLQKQGNEIISSYLSLEGNGPKKHLTKKPGTTEDSKKEGLNNINEDLSTNDLSCKIIEKDVGPGNDFNSEFKRKEENVCLPKNVFLHSENGLTHQKRNCQEQKINLSKDKSEGLPLTEVSNQITSNQHSNARPTKNFKTYKKSAVKISLVNSTSPSVLEAQHDEKIEFLPEGKNILRVSLAADNFGRSSETETTDNNRLQSTAKDDGTNLHCCMSKNLENPLILTENNVSIPSHAIKEKNDLLCNVETKSKALIGFSDENHISSSTMTNNVPSDKNSNEYIFGAVRRNELSSFSQINQVEEKLASVTSHDSIQPPIVAEEVHHTAIKTYSCVPLARRSDMCGKATISSKTGIAQTHCIAASTDATLEENCVQKDLENHHTSSTKNKASTSRKNNERGCNDPLNTSTVNTTGEVKNATSNHGDVPSSYKHHIAGKNKVLPSNGNSTRHGCNGPLNTPTVNTTDEVINSNTNQSDVPTSYKHHIAARNKVLSSNANTTQHGCISSLNTSIANTTDEVINTTSNHADVPTSYKHHIAAWNKVLPSNGNSSQHGCIGSLNTSIANTTDEVINTTSNHADVPTSYKHHIAARNKVLPSNGNSTQRGCNGPLNTSTVNTTDEVINTTSNHADVPTSYKHHIAARNKVLPSNGNSTQRGCNGPLNTSTVNTTDEVINTTSNHADVPTSYKHHIAARNKVLPSNANSTQHDCSGPLNTSTVNTTGEVINTSSNHADVPTSYKRHIAARNKVLPSNGNSTHHNCNVPLNTSTVNTTGEVTNTTSYHADVPTSYKHRIGAKKKEITSPGNRFIPLSSNAALNNSRVNITVKVASSSPSDVCVVAPDKCHIPAPNTAKDKTLFSTDTTQCLMAEGLDCFNDQSGSPIRSNVDKLNSTEQIDINYNLNPSFIDKSKNSNTNIKSGTADTSVNKAHHSSKGVKEQDVNVDVINNINYQGVRIHQKNSLIDPRLVNVGDGIIEAQGCSDIISKYNMETMPDSPNHQCKEASTLKKHNDDSKNYNNKFCGLPSSNEYITMNRLSDIEAFDIPEDNILNTEQFLNNSLDIDFTENFVIDNKIDENIELTLAESNCPLASRTTVIRGCNSAIPTFLEEISNAAFTHDESQVEDPSQYNREFDSLCTGGYISEPNNFFESQLNFTDGKEKGNNESLSKFDNPGLNTYSAHHVELAADTNLTIDPSIIQDNLFDKTNCSNQTKSDHVPHSSTSKEKSVFPIENIKYLRLKSPLEFLPIDDFSDLNSQSIFRW